MCSVVSLALTLKFAGLGVQFVISFTSFSISPGTSAGDLLGVLQ